MADADKEIVNLPALPIFRDDALLVCYVPGSSEPAQKLTGAQLREYAERAAANVKKGDKGDPGDVSSVNGVQPDTKGNVTLTPAQIGALPRDGSAAMTGSLIINANWAGVNFVDKNDVRGAVYINPETDNVFVGTQTDNVPGAVVIGRNALLYVSGDSYNNILHTGNYYHYALPRDGSAAMTGILNLNPVGLGGYAQIYKNAVSDDADYGSLFTDRNAAGKTATLKLRAAADQAIVVLNGVEHDILHTGNKPSGSYTGNGSAATRTIKIGGIGKYLFFRGTHSVIGFVTDYGGIAFNLANGAVTAYLAVSMSFVNGTLTIASSASEINGNGIVFEYQVP